MSATSAYEVQKFKDVEMPEEVNRGAEAPWLLLSLNYMHCSLGELLRLEVRPRSQR